MAGSKVHRERTTATKGSKQARVKTLDRRNLLTAMLLLLQEGKRRR